MYWVSQRESSTSREMPYGYWSRKIFVRWVSVYTKRDGHAQDEKKGFDANDACPEASAEVLEPPYEDKRLSGNRLWVKTLEEAANIEPLVLTSVTIATPVPPSVLITPK